MNRCTGATMMGPCSCGLYHYQSSSYSNIYPMSYDDQDTMCPYASSPNSSVDCTLSLGTPSTRLMNECEKRHNEKRRGSSWWNILQSSSKPAAPSAHKANHCTFTRLMNECEKPHNEKRRGSSWWNILQSSSKPVAPSAHKANHGGGSGNSGNSDSLFSRRCANCDTTSTPLWRNGPRGPKSLCNACGIRYKKEERQSLCNACGIKYKKEERRANAAATAAVTTGGDATEGYLHHHQYTMSSNQWANDYYYNYSQSTYKLSSCYSTNEYRFMDDMEDKDSIESNSI